MKRVYKDKSASVEWSAARNKERSSSRKQTAGQPFVVFPHRFYMGFIFRSPEESFTIVVHDALKGKRVRRLLGEPARRCSVLPRPGPSCRPAVRGPAPTRLWDV